MSDALCTVDLCSEPASRVRGAAFYALKDLARGERALQMLNRSDAVAAAPLLGAFAGALRRHMQAEDEVLAPAFRAAASADSPLAIMLREHGEIRAQLCAVEECLAEEAPDLGEAGAYCAILSGTLAKHEHREESNLFPLWRAQLARLPAARREELMARVNEALGSERVNECKRLPVVAEDSGK